MNLLTLTPDEILNGHLLNAVKGDISPLVYSKKVGRKAGFFAAMQLILTLTDFLGALYTGERPGSARNAVRWIRNYMGQVNGDYKKAAGILYVIWRHGTVHQRHPKKLRMNSKIVTSFGVDNEITCTKSIFAAKGHISVCIPKFYEDFVNSVRLFLTDINRSQSKLQKMKSGWKKSLEPEDWIVVKNRHSDYLKRSDYLFVCKRKP